MPKAPPPPNPRKVVMRAVKKGAPIEVPSRHGPEIVMETAPMDGVHFMVGSVDNVHGLRYLFVEAVKLWEKLDELI